MGDVQVSYWVLGIAIGVKFTQDSSLPKFIPQIADGKWKMSFKVGEHSVTTTGGFHSVAPIMQPPYVETFTCVQVVKTEKRNGDSGDGIWVQKCLNPGSTSSEWTILGPNNIVASFVGFPNKNLQWQVFGRLRRGLAVAELV